MKKLFVLILALVMALSLAACGRDKDPKPSNTPDSRQTEQDTSNPGVSEEGSKWTVAWDDMGLPEDFPRLAEGAAYHELRSDIPIHTIKLMGLTDGEIAQMAEKIGQWAGTDIRWNNAHTYFDLVDNTFFDISGTVGSSEDGSKELSISFYDKRIEGEDTFEGLAASLHLPGLALPDGCQYEKDSMGVFQGIEFAKDSPWTADEQRAIIQSVWDLCKSLSPEGIYKASLTGSTCTIMETYEVVTDLFAEFETSELSNYELTWNYSHEGRSIQLKVMRGYDSETVGIYTYDAGTLAE